MSSTSRLVCLYCLGSVVRRADSSEVNQKGKTTTTKSLCRPGFSDRATRPRANKAEGLNTPEGTIKDQHRRHTIKDNEDNEEKNN